MQFQPRFLCLVFSTAVPCTTGLKPLRQVYTCWSIRARLGPCGKIVTLTQFKFQAKPACGIGACSRGTVIRSQQCECSVLNCGMKSEAPKLSGTRRSLQAMVHSLGKSCNAGLGDLGASLRARRETAICCVVILEKGTPFPADDALHMTISRHAITCIQFRTVH